MKKPAKLLLILLPLLLVLAAGIVLTKYLNPAPARGLARMEQSDAPAAREFLDSYAEEFKALTTATGGIEAGESYSYGMNSGAVWDEEALRAMPTELADALQQIERRHPDCKLSVTLRRGQLGIRLTDDGGGFSLLCYPGDEMMFGSILNGEEGVRRLDMGDGWELQLYYAPKG